MPLSSHGDWNRLIESYKTELLHQYASVSHTVPPSEPIVSPQQIVETESLAPDNTSSLSSDLTDTGYLQIAVSTENQAVPIPGAVITISHNENGQTILNKTAVTDQSGRIPVIELPTKDRNLSLSPGNAVPYTVYTIYVVADGYFSKRFEAVPIYGGVTAVQNITMLPLPEQSENDLPIIYDEPTPTFP